MERLSPAKIQNIWNRFMRGEYRAFFQAHTTMSLSDVMDAGVDRFIYTLGWTKPGDVPSWHNNKIRIGLCAHCREQFLPLMFQYNHGLCGNCRSKYSAKAIKNFISHQLNTSKRYDHAQHDMLMDFYILFYNDEQFRKLFKVGTKDASVLEDLESEIPDWAKRKDIVDVQGEEE